MTKGTGRSADGYQRKGSDKGFVATIRRGGNVS
jgi:hypothetical protein